MDNWVGRIICTDGNMAAAAATTEFPWAIVRFFQSRFSLDKSLESTSMPKKYRGLIAAFDRADVPLSSGASLSPSRAEYDGKAWALRDGTTEHIIRSSPDITPNLNVYSARAGLA